MISKMKHSRRTFIEEIQINKSNLWNLRSTLRICIITLYTKETMGLPPAKFSQEKGIPGASRSSSPCLSCSWLLWFWPSHWPRKDSEDLKWIQFLEFSSLEWSNLIISRMQASSSCSLWAWTSTSHCWLHSSSSAKVWWLLRSAFSWWSRATSSWCSSISTRSPILSG